MLLPQWREQPARGRMLALALTLYEDNIDPSHGQRKDHALDPDLADEWTHMAPVKDYAAEALALAADTVKDEKYPQAWRHIIGLREGWPERKAAKVAARQNPPTEEAPP